MSENKDEIKILKTILDDVKTYDECGENTAFGDEYVKSICERLYQSQPTYEAKISDKPYSLRPKIEIHYDEKEKEEEPEKEDELEKTKEEKKEEETEETKEKEDPVEIEVIKSEVKEPEFIEVIPKHKEILKKTEYKPPEEEELPEWKPIEEEEKPFVFKGYTLYRKKVKLKSGKTQIIYFFSKKKPKSGKKCALPEKYTVGINKRSKMPYLKLKDKKNQKPSYYEKNGYILYVKDVKLKSGKTQTIYFFSKKKPKSGKRCTLPKKYRVKINKRSGMPYLVKK